MYYEIVFNFRDIEMIGEHPFRSIEQHRREKETRIKFFHSSNGEPREWDEKRRKWVK